MHQIELLTPVPRHIGVIDFEGAVWWCPALRWWKEIDTEDLSRRKAFSHVDGPFSLTGTDVDDVFWVWTNRCAEEGILFVGVKD